MPLAAARQGIVASLIAVVVAFASASSCAQQGPKQSAPNLERYKVVLQVSDADPAKWTLALNNALNIQQDLGKDNVEIEIVAYGPGIAMLKGDSKVADRLAQALDNNVGLLACENTMRHINMHEEDMYGGIRFVDAGVVHIMKREREGWAYVRP